MFQSETKMAAKWQQIYSIIQYWCVLERNGRSAKQLGQEDVSSNSLDPKSFNVAQWVALNARVML
jgi:hypothetical protein